MKKVILSLIILTAFTAVLYGQEEFEPIQAGAANFLTIPTNASSAAMGGTGVAVENNDQAIFYNGATTLLNDSRKGGITYNFTPWMRDYESGYSLNSVAGFYKIDKRNALLAGFRYYNYPKVNYKTQETNPTKNIHPKEFAVDLGYARELYSNLALSATLRYIHSDMGNIGDAKSANAIAFDIGAFYKKEMRFLQDANWGLGIQFAHIGSKIKYLDTKEHIPTLAKFGGSVYLPFSNIHKLMATTDLGYRFTPSDVSSINVSVGAEYTLLNHFMLRGGYHYGDKEKADESYGTAGLGVKCQGAHLDFSWLFAESESPLKNTFWISLGYLF